MSLISLLLPRRPLKADSSPIFFFWLCPFLDPFFGRLGPNIPWWSSSVIATPNCPDHAQDHGFVPGQRWCFTSPPMIPLRQRRSLSPSAFPLHGSGTPGQGHRSSGSETKFGSPITNRRCEVLVAALALRKRSSLRTGASVVSLAAVLSRPALRAWQWLAVTDDRFALFP